MRLQVDSSSTGEVDCESLSGKKGLDPRTGDLSDLVLETRLVTDQMTGIDGQFAIDFNHVNPTE